MSTTPTSVPTSNTCESHRRYLGWLGVLVLIGTFAIVSCDSSDDAADEEPITTAVPATTVAPPATVAAEVTATTEATPDAAATTTAPRVSFDGENCTYTGPPTLAPGTTTLTLENTHDTQMDFVQEPSTDASLTMEDVMAWREANLSGGFPLPEPPWMGGWETIGMVMAGQVIDYPTTLSEGTYLLLVSDSVFTMATYPCGVISVTGE